MTRRKGERTPATIEREMPFHVTIIVPANESQIMWDISRLCEFLGGSPGRSIRGDVAKQRYCFASEDHARDFARRVNDAGVEVSSRP